MKKDKLQTVWYKDDAVFGDVRGTTLKVLKKPNVCGLCGCSKFFKCFVRYKKSKQQGGFPCLQGYHFFFVHFVLLFIFLFLLSK